MTAPMTPPGPNTLNTCDHCCTRLEDLSVRFGGTPILEKVNLHVNCREILAIVGPNGAGKSTLLKAILGVVPYRGRIGWRIRGEKRERARIGYVPQSLDFDRAAPVSVADFFACAVSKRPVWLGLARADRKRICRELADVSAEHLIDRRLGDLSGGELQRVLLSLALTDAPDLLLLDEPVSGIDTAGTELFLSIVTRLRDSLDIAVVIVTHDLLGIASHANRMLLLNCAVVAEGTPEEVLASPRIAEVFAGRPRGSAAGRFQPDEGRAES